LIGDTAFALNKNFDSFSPNANFWRSQLKIWLGQSVDQPRAVEPVLPSEGGILDLPQPKK
jgi:hypothetical protein